MKPRFSLFFLLSIFLFAPLFSQAAEPIHSVERGKILFESASYQAAFQEFFELFKETPGDAEINFYLGLSAAKIEDHETAIMAFERVLIADPDAVQAKIELAKSFYKLGAYETAKRYFSEVLDNDVPVEIKENIRQFMATIP